MISSKAPRPAICTIIVKSALACARSLADSFLEHRADGRVFVLLQDQLDGCFEPAKESFTLVQVDQLEIPNFNQLAFRHTARDLGAVVKPFFLQHLFRSTDCHSLCYLDPDSWINRSLDDLHDELNRRLALLLPRRTLLMGDTTVAAERELLSGGIYDPAFIGLARHPALEHFLTWWRKRSLESELEDPGAQSGSPERWLDLVPALFPDVGILGKPDCGVFFHLSRILEEVSGSLETAAGSPSRSSDSSDGRNTCPRPVPWAASGLQHWGPLLAERYRARLQARGLAESRDWPCSYDLFSNEVAIPDFARFLWRFLDPHAQRWPDPRAAHEPGGSYANWLNAPAEDSVPGRVLLTNLAAQLYRHRADLQSAFPALQGNDRTSFARWFVSQGSLEERIDTWFTEAISSSLLETTSEILPEGEPLSVRIRVATADQSPPAYRRISQVLGRVGLRKAFIRILGNRGILLLKKRFFGSGGHAATAMGHATTPASGNPEVPTVRSGESGLLHAQAQPEGLNVVGYLQDETGVGEVPRTILEALHDNGYPVARSTIPSHFIGAADNRISPIPEGVPHAVNLVNVNADQVPIVFRDNPSWFKGKYNIGFWFWELSGFPDVWLESFDYLDEVWTASRFVQETLSTFSPVPVLRMPLPLTRPEPPRLGRKELGLAPERFIFLFVFDMRSFGERKNPLAVVRAYRKAFGGNPNRTSLVVKTNHADLEPELSAQLVEEMVSVGGTLLDQPMRREEVDALFAACDTYVSLHRSEGFGLTMAEAMIRGKAVIATGYSGNMDFMTPENSYPVGYRLVPLTRDHGPYKQGNLWADPDLEGAAATMLKVVEDPDEARRKGDLARLQVLEQYDPRAVSHKIAQRVHRVTAHRRRHGL